MRKLPGNVGGLNAKQDMLSSGGDVTSISYKGQKTKLNQPHLKTGHGDPITSTGRVSRCCCDVVQQTTAEVPRGLMHIPSLDYGYLQSYCQTCWYLQYQTLMLIQTDSSLPCKRGKRLLRLARLSSNSTASHHSHYTAHPSPHLGGTWRYEIIKKNPQQTYQRNPAVLAAAAARAAPGWLPCHRWEGSLGTAAWQS